MILNDYRSQFIELLYNACVADLERLKKCLVNESVFAYAIYCDDGFTSFSSAACTRKSIENYINKANDDAYLYAETFAAEWSYVNNNWQVFDNVNSLIDQIFNSFYDDEIEDLVATSEDLDFHGLHVFFCDVIVASIKKLKTSSCFNIPPFENDILLGLQFGDPSIEARNWIINISEKVNSLKWHKKIIEAYK